MKTNISLHLLLLFFPLIFSLKIKAQTPYVLSGNPEIIVSGTSTLHDWAIKSREAKGQAVVVMKDGQLASITDLIITVPAESLKSGKKMMDNNTYKALKTENHTLIIFKVKKINSINQKNKRAEIIAIGELTIAGETNTIEMNVTCCVEENMISFEGKKSIKMTDYKVEPPAFMMNTVKTGDQIEISYNTKFEPKLPL